MREYYRLRVLVNRHHVAIEGFVGMLATGFKPVEAEITEGFIRGLYAYYRTGVKVSMVQLQGWFIDGHDWEDIQVP